MSRRDDRRTLLLGSAASGLALVVATGAREVVAKPKEERQETEGEVSATEDLMREHGILRRLLLVYREAIARLEARQEVKPESIARAAQIIRAFIEDYHERDEEQYIFPRLQKAGRLLDLVSVLLQQHQAGRRLTADILRLAPAAGPSGLADRPRLTESMRLFIRMYEPHAAREDTVLFPAFRELVGRKELDKLQDIFEDKEKALPGGGFEKVVVEVESVERSIGIQDLAKFTPRVP